MRVSLLWILGLVCATALAASGQDPAEASYRPPRVVPQPVPASAAELLDLYEDALPACLAREPEAYVWSSTSSTADVAAHQPEVEAYCLRLMEDLHGEEGPARLRQSGFLEELPAPNFRESASWVHRVEDGEWEVVTGRGLEVLAWERHSATAQAFFRRFLRGTGAIEVSAWDGDPVGSWNRSILELELPDLARFFRWALQAGVPHEYDLEGQRLVVRWEPRAGNRVPPYLPHFSRLDLWGGPIEVSLQRETEKDEPPVFHYAAEFHDSLGGLLGRQRLVGIAGDLAFHSATREVYRPGMSMPYRVERESLVALPEFPFDTATLLQQAVGVPVRDLRYPEHLAEYAFDGALPSMEELRELLGRSG